MGQEVTIRLASKSDARPVAEIYLSAAREAFDREPEHFRVPSLDEATSLFMPPGAPDAALFVAEMDGRVAGFAEVLLRRPREEPSMLRPRVLGHVRELGVSEDARGTGIGTLLMEAAAKWALSEGAEAIMVDTGAKNTQARRFYGEHLGYRELGVILIKPLS